MTEEKSGFSSYLTPAGAIIAGIAFFLPWVKMSCAGQVMNANGFQLAKNEGLFWLVFGAAILVAVAYFFLRSKWGLGKIRAVVMISSVIALGILLYKYFDFKSSMDSMQGFTANNQQWQSMNESMGGSNSEIEFSLQFGAYICFLGFILAGLGGLFMKEKTAPRLASSGRPATVMGGTARRNFRNSTSPGEYRPSQKTPETECQFCVNGLPPGFISCPECGAQKPPVPR